MLNRFCRQAVGGRGVWGGGSWLAGPFLGQYILASWSRGPVFARDGLGRGAQAVLQKAPVLPLPGSKRDLPGAKARGQVRMPQAQKAKAPLCSSAPWCGFLPSANWCVSWWFSQTAATCDWEREVWGPSSLQGLPNICVSWNRKAPVTKQKSMPVPPQIPAQVHPDSWGGSSPFNPTPCTCAPHPREALLRWLLGGSQSSIWVPGGCGHCPLGLTHNKSECRWRHASF